MITSDWRGQPGWTPELEFGAPPARFIPIDPPIEELEGKATAYQLTPTVHSVDLFEAGEDVGRYAPHDVDAVPVAEVHVQRPGGRGSGFELYLSERDEFFVEAGSNGAHSHGPAGRWSVPDRSAERPAVAVATSGEDAEEVVDAFIALPHEELAHTHLEGTRVFGVDTGNLTFGGGDDPVWMLTLLPEPYDPLIDPTFPDRFPGADLWA